MLKHLEIKTYKTLHLKLSTLSKGQIITYMERHPIFTNHKTEYCEMAVIPKLV